MTYKPPPPTRYSTRVYGGLTDFVDLDFHTPADLQAAYDEGLADGLRGRWQPIETAPKDGTQIDLWSPEHGRLADYFRVNWAKGNIFYDPVHSGVTCVRDATHWMPPPAKPEATK